jgi:anti-sigma-K factor RskA
MEALAAEYVLGTLDADEHRAAEARILADVDFRRAVADWEATLQPLADGAVPVDPPSGAFAGILARVTADGPPMSGNRVTDSPNAGNVVALRRSVRRWRWMASLAAAAAVVLLAVVAVDRLHAPQTTFVATLTADGAAPAFVLTVDTVANTLQIRRVAAAAPPGKSYELWAVEPGAQPKSMGVVEQASLKRSLPYSPKDLVFAISLEPRGGSPTGVATGPIVFSGPLVPAE